MISCRRNYRSGNALGCLPYDLDATAVVDYATAPANGADPPGLAGDHSLACERNDLSIGLSIQRGLIHEGEGFVSKLDGIFAFALVDLESLTVLLGRDIFGVKPLYFFSREQRFYVGSEVRPLWKLSGNELDRANIARYLSTGTIGDGGTIVSGVS